MTEVTSISGDVDYVESKLQELMNDEWEIISLESFSYPAISSIRFQSIAYLKKTAQS